MNNFIRSFFCVRSLDVLFSFSLSLSIFTARFVCCVYFTITIITHTLECKWSIFSKLNYTISCSMFFSSAHASFAAHTYICLICYYFFGRVFVVNINQYTYIFIWNVPVEMHSHLIGFPLLFYRSIGLFSMRFFRSLFAIAHEHETQNTHFLRYSIFSYRQKNTGKNSFSFILS